MLKGFSKCLIFYSVVAALNSCSSDSPQEAQGYIDGGYTYMATPVSGEVKQLLVDRGDRVKQGQQLLVLDAQPESDEYKAAVETLKQSVSARDAIAANLVYAKLTFERNKVLVPKKAIQQSALDNARALYESTIAQLAQANAAISEAESTLAKAKWTTEQKILYAPEEAIVFQKYYRLGEYAVANQPILALLAPRNIKVIFFVREKYLGAIHLQDKISS